ncbi:MAG: tRNA dimethylallyltransferase, partial [Patescibacteria group bacterium]|nr:tRNA dimethylallyltransferase [Patescibacteria group bacterium]
PHELLEELVRLDPRRAKTIEPHNQRRLIRAIEIARALGSVPKIQSREKYDVLYIGLALPDNELRGRIAVRLKVRLRRGLIAEVARLHEKDKLSWQRLDSFGLEYRYVSRFIRGMLTRNELERILEQKIWQYARRQKTWFKRNQNILWLPVVERSNIEQTVDRFVHQKTTRTDRIRIEHE